MYYNTTAQTDPELKVLRNRAKTQEEIILRMFKIMPDAKMTAWHIEKFTRYPITSIRRALTDLSADGKLKVTGKRAAGPYAHKCFEYQYVEESR